MAKTGRNHPCPCGSGKKYKHCCYGKESPVEQSDAWADDSDWIKIRRTEGEIVSAVIDFAITQHPDLLIEAAHEFTFWGEYELEDNLVESVLIPWTVFNWTPEPFDAESTDRDQVLALQYLYEKSELLDAYKQPFI